MRLLLALAFSVLLSSAALAQELGRWQATIVDDTGAPQAGAEVEVRDESTAALVQLYSDRAGATPIGNPVTADSEGFVAFHVPGGAYRIDAENGAFTRTWRYVPIGTAAEYDITAVGDIAEEAVSDVVKTYRIVRQVFTATGTYTATTGMISARVQLQAPGGGSGGADGVGNNNPDGVAAGGGGGGEYGEASYTAAEMGATAVVTLGSGGAAGSATGGNGGTGGATNFNPAGTGTTLTVTPGDGGNGTGSDSVDSGSEAGGAVATGGSGPSGSFFIPGQGGARSIVHADDSLGSWCAQGDGGSSQMGRGARAVISGVFACADQAGVAGNNYGGGAAGASDNDTTGSAGAAGGASICIVEEFIEE